MILVFGSINLDIVVPVPRLPRPGETVLGGDYALLPGGKGANQAVAACRAGAEVMVAGAIGDDAFGKLALAPLLQAGIDTRLVRLVERPTGCATVIVEPGGENAIAVASGANGAVSCTQVLDDVLGPATMLVLQMEVPVRENEAMIRRVRARGGRILLNLAPALAIDRGVLAEVDVIVANQAEAAALDDAPAPRQAMVVTRGAAGAVAVRHDGFRLEVPALGINPVDTTGAGDTFVGVLAAGLDRGRSLEPALRRASAAAGLACLARGAQTAMPGAAAIENAVGRLRQ